MSKNKTPPRLSFVETLLSHIHVRGGSVLVDGVLDTATRPAYTCNETDQSRIMPLAMVRETWQLFLDQTKDMEGANLYCQYHFNAEGETPRVIRVVREPDAAYEARINGAKLAKVNTLNERLAQHEAAAAALRNELEKVKAE